MRWCRASTSIPHAISNIISSMNCFYPIHEWQMIGAPINWHSTMSPRASGFDHHLVACKTAGSPQRAYPHCKRWDVLHRVLRSAFVECLAPLGLAQGGPYIFPDLSHLNLTSIDSKMRKRQGDWLIMQLMCVKVYPLVHAHSGYFNEVIYAIQQRTRDTFLVFGNSRFRTSAPIVSIHTPPAETGIYTNGSVIHVLARKKLCPFIIP